MKIWVILTLALTVHNAYAQFMLGEDGLKIPPINLFRVFNIIRKGYYQLMYPDSYISTKRKKKHQKQSRKDSEVTTNDTAVTSLDDLVLEKIIAKVNATCSKNDTVCEDLIIEDLIKNVTFDTYDTVQNREIQQDTSSSGNKKLKPEEKFLPAAALLHTPQRVGFNYVGAYAVLCLVLLLIFLGISAPYFLRGIPIPGSLLEGAGGGNGEGDGEGENNMNETSLYEEDMNMTMMMNYSMSLDIDDLEMEMMNDTMAMMERIPERNISESMKNNLTAKDMEIYYPNMTRTISMAEANVLNQGNYTRQKTGMNQMNGLQMPINSSLLQMISKRPITGMNHMNAMGNMNGPSHVNGGINIMNGLHHMNVTRAINVIGQKNEMKKEDGSPTIVTIANKTKSVGMDQINPVKQMNVATSQNGVSQFSGIYQQKGMNRVNGMNQNNVMHHLSKVNQINDLSQIGIIKPINGNRKADGMTQTHETRRINGTDQTFGVGQLNNKWISSGISQINGIGQIGTSIQINGTANTSRISGMGQINNMAQTRDFRNLTGIGQMNRKNPIIIKGQLIGTSVVYGTEQVQDLRPVYYGNRHRNEHSNTNIRGRIKNATHIKETSSLNNVQMKNSMQEKKIAQSNSTEQMNEMKKKEETIKLNRINSNSQRNNASNMDFMLDRDYNSKQANETVLNINIRHINYSVPMKAIDESNTFPMGMKRNGEIVNLKNINAFGQRNDAIPMDVLLNLDVIKNNGQKQWLKQTTHIPSITSNEQLNEIELDNGEDQMNKHGEIYGKEQFNKNSMNFKEVHNVITKGNDTSPLNNERKINWASKIGKITNGRMSDGVNTNDMDRILRTNITVPVENKGWIENHKIISYKEQPHVLTQLYGTGRKNGFHINKEELNHDVPLNGVSSSKGLPFVNIIPLPSNTPYRTTLASAGVSGFRHRSGLPQGNEATNDASERSTLYGINKDLENLSAMEPKTVKKKESFCQNHVLCLRPMLERSALTASHLTLNILNWIPGMGPVKEALNRKLEKFTQSAKDK